MQLIYDEMNSPIGPLTLGAVVDAEGGRAGLCQIEFGAAKSVLGKLGIWSGRWFGTEAWSRDEASLADARSQLDEYFHGSRTRFELPLALRGTSFQLRVWEALLRVPYGTTVSYKQIGQSIGDEKAVRAVGGANHRNPVPIIVPCHRVIGKNGQLVGYGGGLAIKEELLRLEGISIAG